MQSTKGVDKPERVTRFMVKIPKRSSAAGLDWSGGIKACTCPYSEGLTWKVCIITAASWATNTRSCVRLSRWNENRLSTLTCFGWWILPKETYRKYQNQSLFRTRADIGVPVRSTKQERPKSATHHMETNPSTPLNTIISQIPSQKCILWWISFSSLRICTYLIWCS